MISPTLPLNPRFAALNPYPFERYKELLGSVTPSTEYAPIDLSIGEPKHPTPALLRDAVSGHLDGLARYPATAGSVELREAIGQWLQRRCAPARLDPLTQVLPILGSREALFAIAQVVIDPAGEDIVVCPNPFYQIYEGAAVLAGATPHYVPLTPGRAMTADWASVAPTTWARTRLLYVCSPGNPTGDIIGIEEWRYLFELSDKYGFVIASDECYGELYRVNQPQPPIGALQAAAELGRGHDRLIAFGSLSKRSNAPGLRSGYVAGGAALIGQFLRYRTYHGSAMSPTVQSASIAAWSDERHVLENRALYDAKYAQVTPLLADALNASTPPAGFYLWADVPGGDDQSFARDLYRQYNVRVLPGSYLGRAVQGVNPGSGKVRIALVDTLERCVEAAHRIRRFCQ